MEPKYSFLRSDFSFFDENDGFRTEFDLLTFEYDDESSYGMVEKVITEARLTLAGVPTDAARAMLWVADSFVNIALDDVTVVHPNGEAIPRDQIDFKSVNQLDFIHLALLPISRDTIRIGDEGFDDSLIDVTPARFCAAYALRMMYNATRSHLNHGDASDLRDYYLMQAATAYGLMKSFINEEDFSISNAISLSIQSKKVKKMAARRWEVDPKSSAMEQVKVKWEQMLGGATSFRSDAQFARDMMKDHGEELSEGGIKNAIVRWRKERK